MLVYICHGFKNEMLSRTRILLLHVIPSLFRIISDKVLFFLLCASTVCYPETSKFLHKLHNNVFYMNKISFLGPLKIVLSKEERTYAGGS